MSNWFEKENRRNVINNLGIIAETKKTTTAELLAKAGISMERIGELLTLSDEFTQQEIVMTVNGLRMTSEEIRWTFFPKLPMIDRIRIVCDMGGKDFDQVMESAGISASRAEKIKKKETDMTVGELDTICEMIKTSPAYFYQGV